MKQGIRILLCFLLLLQLVPPLLVFDVTSLRHWLMALFDVFAIGFLFFIAMKKERINIKALRTAPFLLFMLLILFMVASMFQSVNMIESIAVLNRWIIVFICALTTCLIMDKDNKSFDWIVKISVWIAAINVLECIVPYYWCEVYKNQRDNLLLNGCYGNKNIFSVALLFKLPFLFYAFYNFKKLWRWFALVLVFLITFCLVILSTRSSFIGLILQLLALTTFILWYKRKIWKRLIVVGVALLGFFAGDWFIEFNYNHFATHQNVNQYTLNSRFESIAEGNSKGRLKIWHNTWAIIKDKPLLGYGIGNHKLAIMKEEAAKKTGWIVSDHAHNDYLEMWSELGVLGLLSYLLLASCLFVLSLRYAFGRRYDEYWRWLSFTALLCFLIYFNDSFFNFPAERASCQLYFALGIAMLTLVIVRDRAMARKRSIMILILLFILMIPVLYIEGNHYVSSIRQKQRVLQNNGNKKYAYSFEQWLKRMPFLPNIDENCKPIAVNNASIAIINIKRFNLPAKQQYRKAIDLLLSDNSNPYYGLREYRLGNYYYNYGVTDSAIFWSQRCIEMKPLCYDPVRILYYCYNKMNRDSVAAKEIMNYMKRCDTAGVEQDRNAILDLEDINAKTESTK
ncbi:MAG: O-antigen ligase family protein [Bacteroidales bacterium]|jgi:O-antigen ligase|nr:O-antigen ligase family protein [Bacteroidales bacterium]